MPQPRIGGSTEIASIKTCTKCKQNLPIASFSMRPKSKDGRHTQCRSCTLDQVRKWRARMKLLRPVRQSCPCGAAINSQNTYGLCPQCSKPARNRKYYERNKEFVTECNKQYKKRNAEKYYAYSRRPDNRWKSAASTAKRRGLVWQIDFESWQKIIAQGCYYCASTLSDGAGSGLDRIDNTLGYFLENVLPCCGDCNATRMDRYSVEETKVMIQALKQLRAQ